jgi:hypothetical protein
MSVARSWLSPLASTRPQGAAHDSFRADRAALSKSAQMLKMGERAISAELARRSGKIMMDHRSNPYIRKVTANIGPRIFNFGVRYQLIFGASEICRRAATRCRVPSGSSFATSL